MEKNICIFLFDYIAYNDLSNVMFGCACILVFSKVVKYLYACIVFSKVMKYLYACITRL
jgi:hypothetical protein